MPINGLTSAAQALRYWERRQEVSSNNLANVSTDGFKAERVFGQLMDGGPVIGTATDTRAGTMRQTAQPLDVALGNDGFLVVQTSAGERYSRGGSLQVDAEGFLADQDGARVLGNGGPVKIPAGNVVIDKTGSISVAGKSVDQLRVERAPKDVALQHEGGTHFVPATQRETVASNERDIRQGAVEESNVGSLGGLVDMISVQRAYAAVEKTIGVLDHVREVATSQLGRPAN